MNARNHDSETPLAYLLDNSDDELLTSRTAAVLRRLGGSESTLQTIQT